MRTLRLILLVALAGLFALLIYRQLRLGSLARGRLHRSALYVTNRPAPSQRDLTELFPERAPSQVAIHLTQSEPSAESPVRCLQAMGIPFFVTLDLSTALRHKL